MINPEMPKHIGIVKRSCGADNTKLRDELEKARMLQDAWDYFEQARGEAHPMKRDVIGIKPLLPQGK
jgi:hypothetical protein